MGGNTSQGGSHLSYGIFLRVPKGPKAAASLGTFLIFRRPFFNPELNPVSNRLPTPPSSFFFHGLPTGGPMVSPTETIPRLIKVLLAEDNLADAALVMEAFKTSKRHIWLVSLNNGDEVMDHLRGQGGFKPSNRPDLILLDLNLPLKNGFDVLAELKADPLLRDIPVVILTNSRSEEDVRQAYEAGANYYVMKPADFDEFRSAIHRVEEIFLVGVDERED